MRRLLVMLVVLAALGGTATLTYAAGRQLASAPATPPVPAAQKLATLVVPDVRREAFVFAKEQLQDGGFAWRVAGAVRGFAANTVVAQSPAPGTTVLDTGAPPVRLTLARNPKYRPVGEPQDISPYAPTALRVER